MTATKDLKKIKEKYAANATKAQNLAAKELALAIVEVIRLRTREEKKGTKGNLKKLKPSTIKFRERHQGNLHPDTTPSTSNLTASGQLLDAIQGYAQGRFAKVNMKLGKRKPGIDGRKSDLTNEDLRKYVEETREFLALSAREKKEAQALAAQLFEENFKSLLK